MKSKEITITNSSCKQDNAEARVTNPEKVRQIIEQYIDQVDADIYNDGFVWHPFCRNQGWPGEAAFPGKAAVLEIMSKPDGLKEINDMAKSAIKKFLSKFSLKDTFQCIGAGYSFKVLRDAKEYLSTDELTQLLRATWEASDFHFCEDADFSNDDLWELLQSCDPQKFMTSEERAAFPDCVTFVGTLFQGEDFTNPLVWTDSAAKLIIAADGRFGHVSRHRGYSAHIESEDVFAVIFGLGEGTGYIVNPNKLQDVTFEWDLREFCDRDELSEEDWDDNDDWDD